MAKKNLHFRHIDPDTPTPFSRSIDVPSAKVPQKQTLLKSGGYIGPRSITMPLGKDYRSTPLKRLVEIPQGKRRSSTVLSTKKDDDIMSWMANLRQKAQNTLKDVKRRDDELEKEVTILRLQQQIRTEEFNKLGNYLLQEEDTKRKRQLEQYNSGPSLKKVKRDDDKVSLCFGFFIFTYH